MWGDFYSWKIENEMNLQDQGTINGIEWIQVKLRKKLVTRPAEDVHVRVFLKKGILAGEVVKKKEHSYTVGGNIN